MSFNPEEFFSKKEPTIPANPFADTSAVEQKLESVTAETVENTKGNSSIADALKARANAIAQGGTTVQQQVSQGNGEVGGISSTSQVSVVPNSLPEMQVVSAQQEEAKAMEDLKRISDAQPSQVEQILIETIVDNSSDEALLAELLGGTPITVNTTNPTEPPVQPELHQTEQMTPMVDTAQPSQPSQSPQPSQPVSQELPEQSSEGLPNLATSHSPEEVRVSQVPISDSRANMRARVAEQIKETEMLESGTMKDERGDLIAAMTVHQEEGEIDTTSQTVTADVQEENDSLLAELTSKGAPSQPAEQKQEMQSNPNNHIQEQAPTSEPPMDYYVEPPHQQHYEQPAPQQQYAQQQQPAPQYQQHYEQPVPQQQQHQQPAQPPVPQQQYEQHQQQYQQPAPQNQEPQQQAPQQLVTGTVMSPVKLFQAGVISFSSASLHLDNFNNGNNVNGEAYIKTIKYSKYNKGTKTDFVFTIANGDTLVGVHWGTLQGYTSETVSELKGKVVSVAGKWNSYNNNKQIVVNSIASATTTTISNYIAGAGDLSQHDVIFEELYNNLQNPIWKNFIYFVFMTKGFLDFYKDTPAAASVHDSLPDGLYRHTIKVAYNAYHSAKLYSEINSDVVIVASKLHDLGKIYELVGGNYTEDGILFGHIYMGAKLTEQLFQEFEAQYSCELDLNEKKNIIHCILSHHGEKEWGAVVNPATAEAKLLHSADRLDAQVTGLTDYIGSGRRSEIPYPRQTIFNLNK